jgi:hypothetical protein
MRLTQVLLAASISVTGGVLTSMAAQAGSGNLIVIEQQGSSNTLYVDQSEATDSQVGGLVPDASSPTEYSALLLTGSSLLDYPALQLGENNEANITISDLGGAVYLLQNNQSAGFSPSGNKATVILSAEGAFAAVNQSGGKNTATINVSGEFSSGTIFQFGDGNTGSVTVPFGDTIARLEQIGDNISAGLKVIGAQGGDVTLTVNGDNITQAYGPVVVYSNGASVTITQTQ